ncbi:MAG: TetR/AcrR family transcriptional regulator [Reyranella sp.]|uniref:TetR/AcrR family transcriptional regulator n=1 Tax=Reyranella sp. TaxID=1929291 RepID=UPI0012267818|nr:TetR/AcrR family transcriptional regulator [Reyranella sp.]TAJ42939.1 MAG: TetR/AcrR family transcriptional regulator [Reyranella sp.]
MAALSTAVVSGRKKRGEGHTRREEILLAAKELFLEEGYDATTIRRIADRVGVSAPALYLYFHDKEAMMLALCDQTFGLLVERITEIEKTVSDPLERVRRFGEAYARFGLENPDEYRLVFIGNNIPESIRKVGHRMPVDDPSRPGVGGALVFSRLVALLSQLETSGVKLNYPPDTCAELCWMGIHGVVAALIMKPDFPWSNRETLIQGMQDIVIKGILR